MLASYGGAPDGAPPRDSGGIRQVWRDNGSRLARPPRRLRLPFGGKEEYSMVIFRSSHRILFRYDVSSISLLILGGSIRVSTLEYCRNAENESARDVGEGMKTITSLPGTNSLNSLDLARLLGVDPRGIQVSGPNAVVTGGENAVHRTEAIENAFVLCTSAIENDKSLKTRFGGSCLKIKDAVAFFESVDEQLRRAVAPRKLGECIVDDVEYASRTNNYRNHTTKHGAFIKPYGGKSSFEIEAEVRGLWIPQDFKSEPMILDIPNVSKLLERLP
jgi:hypothetical protein